MTNTQRDQLATPVVLVYWLFVVVGTWFSCSTAPFSSRLPSEL